MFDFQQQSNIQRLPYLHGIDKHRVLVELEDYVSPEFVEYYFYRFGYDIESMEIAPVQGVITRQISESELKRISAHPFVQDIKIESYEFTSPFLGSNLYFGDNTRRKIAFSYYVTDEMIEAFLFQNQKLGIEILPRRTRSVVLNPTKVPSRLMAELNMLIYVRNTTEIFE